MRTLPLAEAKAKLSRLVDRVAETDEEILGLIPWETKPRRAESASASAPPGVRRSRTE